MKHHQFIAVVVAGAILVACGGGSDDASSDTDSTGTAAGVDTSVENPTSDDAANGEPEVDLPQFEGDFDRVCTTQVGFGGATPLSGEPGPHPMVLFQETDDGVLITSSLDLPAGWLVVQDSDFEDNSELAATELVGCSQITAKTPNGVSCDLEGDDDETITLDLVDVSYELTVYEATTGELVGTETIEAASTDCPFFVFIDEGQTDYFNTPDADQYTNALKAYITP